MATVVRTTEGIESLRIRIKELDKLKLAVGWFESARYDDQTPVAGVAAVQEFGSPKLGIPPRPFMRSAIEDNEESWKKIVEQASKGILNGSETSESAMEKLGLFVFGNVLDKLTGNHEELSPVTIALRKFKNENPNFVYGRQFVSWVADAVNDGETGPGQLGDQSFGNKKPLNDTGLMIASLTYEVSE